MSNNIAAFGQVIANSLVHKYLLLSNCRGVVTVAFSGDCQKTILVRVTSWGVSAMIHINLSCLC